jgi:molybdopterin synthase catalytic subunit
MQIKIAVQEAVFDIAAEHAALAAAHELIGAIASFVGYVRADKPQTTVGEPVRLLTLEHYPGMTEKALRDIVARAKERWPLDGATIIHRVGPLQPGEPIVLVLTASAHRQAAFDSCNFIMDYLKTEAPFWKKEQIGNASHWVDARESDDAAKLRWE